MFLNAGFVLSFASSLTVLAAPSHHIRGAAYFMNNDQHGNYIIAHTIQNDGTVQYASKTYTGGQGNRMTQYSDIGADALLGQSCLVQDRGYLYVVNPSSDSVSMLKIDTEDPSKLTLVGKPIRSNYEFPLAVAANKHTGQVCATFSGKWNGVECYKPTAQGLVTIPNTSRSLDIMNQTTPANFMTESSSASILFSEDGKKLISIQKGTHGPLGALIQPGLHGWFNVWDIYADGSLSKTYTRTTVQRPGLLPFAAVPIEGTKALAVADPTSGGEIWDFSKSDTAEIQYFSLPTNKMVCWISYSPSTDHYFLTDFDVGQVIEVSIDKKNLKMHYVKSYPEIGATAQPLDNAIATINGKDYLYQLSPNTTELTVMALKAGDSKIVQKYNYLSATMKTGVPVDPSFVQGMQVWLKD
jgi:hypothetical protein